MRLCRHCAFPVGPLDARCGRCGRAWPYYTAQRKGREGGGGGARAALLARGKDCPRCGVRTSRQPTPLRWRPLRWVLGERFSFRRCRACRWAGPSLHGPRGNTPHRTP